MINHSCSYFAEYSVSFLTWVYKGGLVVWMSEAVAPCSGLYLGYLVMATHSLG